MIMKMKMKMNIIYIKIMTKFYEQKNALHHQKVVIQNQKIIPEYQMMLVVQIGIYQTLVLLKINL